MLLLIGPGAAEVRKVISFQPAAERAAVQAATCEEVEARPQVADPGRLSELHVSDCVRPSGEMGVTGGDLRDKSIPGVNYT